MSERPIEITHRTRPGWTWVAIGAAGVLWGVLGLTLGWQTRYGGDGTWAMVTLLVLGAAVFTSFGVTQTSVLAGARLRHTIRLLGVPLWWRRVTSSEVTTVCVDARDRDRSLCELTVEMGYDRVRLELSGDYEGMRQRAQRLADALDVPLVDTAADGAARFS